MSELRPYNVLLTTTTAIYLNHLKYATPTDYAVSADWTPAAGDVKISKDGGAAANVTNLPTYTTDVGWKYILTAAELTAKQVVVRIADSATKAIVDDMFVVETTSNASAMWPDPDATTPVLVDVVKISGDATAADNAESYFDGTGYAGTANTTGLASGSVTAAVIADGAIDAATFASGAITAAAIAADAIGASELATDAVTEIAAAVAAAIAVVSGTAVAAGGSTLTLAATASAVNDAYLNQVVVITAGTGAGQIRRITGYVGATKVATVATAWSPTPDTTSEYAVIGN